MKILYAKFIDIVRHPLLYLRWIDNNKSWTFSPNNTGCVTFGWYIKANK